MDRREIGSWLSTPGQAPDTLTVPQQYRGERLGLPPEGAGAIASFGRRLLALIIDWIAALLITSLVTPWSYGEGDYGLVTLAIFAVEVTLFTWLTGSSFGQRVTRVAVVRVDGVRLGLLAAGLRTVLICLVIPPLVWDADLRGLHDKAAKTVTVVR